MAKRKTVNPVAHTKAVSEDRPASPPATLSPKDLTAAFYRVTRVTAGGDIAHQIDGQPVLFVPGVKDPTEEDPNSPAYMTDGERALYPDGIRWSGLLDKRTVKSLIADPTIARHFTVDPLDAGDV